MRRIPEKPRHAYFVLNAYAFVALLTAASGVALPPVSLAAAALLLLGPPLVLVYCQYHVSRAAQPSRDEQVLRLVGIYTLGTLLIGNVTVTQIATVLRGAAVVPGAPALSIVDRVVLAITSGLLMWGLLAGLAYGADSILDTHRAFQRSWHCRRCGYDLRGCTGDRCPECFEPIRCRRCGHSMTGQRDDVCIYCGTPRVADPHTADE